MIDMLKSALGLFSGASIVNTGSGIVNHVALAAVVSWAIANPEAIVTFTVSRLGLLVAAGVVWALLEMNRRTRPPQ